MIKDTMCEKNALKNASIKKGANYIKQNLIPWKENLIKNTFILKKLKSLLKSHRDLIEKRQKLKRLPTIKCIACMSQVENLNIHPAFNHNITSLAGEIK